MSFSRPELLALAALAALELILCLRRLPSFRASFGALAGPRGRRRSERRFTAMSAASGIAAALFIAVSACVLAGPSWGARSAAVERRGLEASIVLDVSRSMEARDMAAGRGYESRLEAARDLVSSLVGPGDAGRGDSAGMSFSLVAAKGGAVLLVPMTEDRLAIEDALSYANPDAITTPGTDLESGLRIAFSSFSPSGAQGRLVFLFTDGGELSGSAMRAASEAAAVRARLVVVGLGGAAPAQVPGKDGTPLAGSKGPVLSALDAKALEALAASAGGRYIEASQPGAASALRAELAAATGTGTRVEYRSVDRGSLLSLAALALLVLSVVFAMLAPRRPAR